MDELKETLIEEIKKRMADCKITRQVLADMSGVAVSSIYNVLNGKASTDTVLVVAKTLNINIVEIYLT